MKLGKIRLSLFSMMVLFLLLVIIQMYWIAVLDSGKPFGGRTSLSFGYGPLHKGAVLYSDHGYALLSRGDRLSIDISVSGAIPWQYYLVFVDLASSKTYSFNATYYSSRAPTPLFIAPTSSLYFYNLTIISGSNVSEYTINLKISGQQADRQNVIVRILLAGLTIIIITVIIEFFNRIIILKNRFIILLSWELRTLWIWIFYGITLCIYAIFYLSFSADIGRNPLVLLKSIAFCRKEDFFIIYTLLAASILVMLYTYQWEIKLDRTMDLLPLSRVKRFFIKLLLVFILLYLPIVVVSLLLYLIWLPNLIIGNPMLFFSIYSMEILYYLCIVLLIISFSLLPAIFVPRTSLALPIAALPSILLYMGVFQDIVDFDFKRYLIGYDPYMHIMVPRLDMVPSPLDLLYKVIIFFIIITLLSLFVYMYRENP